VIVETVDFQARLNALRRAELVDYTASPISKPVVLERLYRHFRKQHLDANTPRAAAFRAYQAEGRTDLAVYALPSAAGTSVRKGCNNWGWPVWPEAYRDPSSAAVPHLPHEHQIRVEYFQYLQWLAAEQLEPSRRTCCQ
jgi:4-alpha-glucanotransferase